MKRWLAGSVAKAAVRQSPVPVLVLHEKSMLSLPEAGHSLRVLVTLDGSPLSETALAPAAHLSAALSTSAPGVLHLVRVLQIPSLDVYGQNDHAMEESRRALAEAKAYLGALEQRLREGDLAHLHLVISSSLAASTDVAGAISKLAECLKDVEGWDGCDLIAMAPHGRQGLQRLVRGSATQHVLDETTLPLLIVRRYATAVQAQPNDASQVEAAGIDPENLAFTIPATLFPDDRTAYITLPHCTC